MADNQTIEQARFIFTTGKLLRRHIFSGLARMEAAEGTCGCSELSLAQFNLLMTVQASGEITGGELAAQLGVSAPSVSVMVEKLVERGYLVRERSREDRRKVVLRMSSNREQHFARLEEQLLAGFVELVEDVGEETAARWVEVLQRVQKVLEQRLDKKSEAKRK